MQLNIHIKSYQVVYNLLCSPLFHSEGKSTLAPHKILTMVVMKMAYTLYIEKPFLFFRLIAVTLDRKVQVWHAPGANKEFAAFKLLHTHTGFYSDTTTIDWSDDSR